MILPTKQNDRLQIACGSSSANQVNLIHAQLRCLCSAYDGPERQLLAANPMFREGIVFLAVPCRI